MRENFSFLSGCFLGMRNEREGYPDWGFSRGGWNWRKGRGGGGLLSKVALATLMAAQPSLSLSLIHSFLTHLRPHLTTNIPPPPHILSTLPVPTPANFHKKHQGPPCPRFSETKNPIVFSVYAKLSGR